MNSESLQEMLNAKENNGEQITEAILEDPGLIKEVMAGISAGSPTVRFKCAKILRLISAAKPETLYPTFDFFANLLDDQINILKWNAMDVIANMAAVDGEGKLDRIFEKYYGLLHAGSLITAAHVVENSGKIARAKPRLRAKIARKMLKVEEIPLPTAECRNIIAGKLITAFGQYPELITDKNAVVSFVTGQLNNPRNATRKKAEAFLRGRIPPQK
jgi:hypothetical protein